MPLISESTKGAGYRDLSQEEIDLMNDVKVQAAQAGALVECLENDIPEIDRRWLAIARTDLQKGFMSLMRSIAKPESF